MPRVKTQETAKGGGGGGEQGEIIRKARSRGEKEREVLTGDRRSRKKKKRKWWLGVRRAHRVWKVPGGFGSINTGAG